MKIYQISTDTNLPHDTVREITTNMVLKHPADLKLSVDHAFNQEEFGFDLNAYEIEHYKTHYQIWEHFLANDNVGWCLIYDQKVSFHLPFEELFAQLETLPRETMVFFPYDHQKGVGKFSAPSICNSRLGYSWGSYVYFLNREGAKKLLENTIITKPVDEEILKLSFEHAIKTVFANTDWFEFDQKNARSFIERKLSLKNAMFSHPAWTLEQKASALQILDHLIRHARTLKIKLMLHAGTLLGYIRHGCIMPWDDDIDISAKEEDTYRLIAAIEEEGILNVTAWTYKKTGATYYKFWMAGGEKAEGYAYTFPFIDIWLVYDQDDGSVKLTDGYVFEHADYLPPKDISFEGLSLSVPHRPEIVLDQMYTDWKHKIQIFSWCHRTKKSMFKRLSLNIEVDKTGRMI